ncbi:hypothetical protein F511_15957 [Dorcoceras hygrometricum]|uniref:Las1-like family protein n=1 Tax=Dorcoceras hygrometricum TaxID=472368 RepID=A0A2Z7BP98_9LAMI|nr:hypothetical protein F511_15957 [Dorcoceras hygrometricum]
MDQAAFAYNEGPTHEHDHLKFVPWSSWDEWRFVRESLFSSSPDLVASALQRIRTYQSRACIPSEVEVTASIIETQQNDPFFRHDLNESARQLVEALSLQYCMAIMRLVNGMIEKTRKKNEVSIGEAADAIGIPRMLIDIRHEGSHRDLPSLKLLRRASEKAVDWLISYYWEPQDKAISNHSIQMENLKKKTKHRLQKISLCRKAKIAVKAKNSSSEGSKKRLNKLLKNVLLLYSSFSPQVAHVLLELLLDELDSSTLTEPLEGSQIEQCTENNRTAYGDWKYIVLRLSRREPEILVSLADTILEKMEALKMMNYGSGEHRPLEDSLKSHGFEVLTSLFEWLVPHLKMLNTVGQQESSDHQGFPVERCNASLTGLLRRCLLVSFPENKQLMRPALIIAHLIGDPSLLHKIQKLSSLVLSDLVPNSDSPGDSIAHSQQEDSLLQAEEKFELVKQYRIKSKAVKPKESELRPKSRRQVVTSWNACPIGMLPCTTGFSGRLPSLHCADESLEVAKLSVSKDFGELKKCSNKRKAESAIQESNNSSSKKVKEIKPNCESYDGDDISTEGVKGHLMIDGVRTKIGEEEFLAIASAVRLLV